MQENKKGMSIKIRLILVISLVTLIMLLGNSLISYYQSKTIIETMAFNAATESAQLNGEIIETWIKGKGEKLFMLSKTDEITGMDWSQQGPLLKEIVQAEDDLEAMFVADPTGRANSSLDEEIDIRDRDYFRKALQTGQVTYSQPTVSRLTGVTTIVVAQPIINEGNIIGILGATLLLDHLQILVQKMKINGYGHGWIIDANGDTVAHPNQQYLGNQNVFRGNSALRELADKMIQGQSGMGHYLLDGISKGLAYAPIPVTNWSIAMTADTKDVLASVSVLRNYSVIITVISIIIGAIVAFFVASYIVNPIINIRDLVQIVADGDLTIDVEVQSNDEIGELGQAFNTMVSNLRMLIGGINEAAGHLSSASQQLNANCEESAAGAEQTAATMNEIASTVQQVVSDIQLISDGSNETAHQASRGNEGIAQVTDQMDTIAKSSRQVGQSIEELHDQTQQINQVLALIDGFAEQTNLLALNATIEAARAGDYGRGFAVVADEVRSLAEQSATATANIQQLVGAIQAESGEVVNLTQLSEEEVEAGSGVVKTVGERFLEIVKGVQILNEQFEGILSATQEMAAGIEQVAATSQEQTASSEEVAAATQSLSELSQNLSNMISEFKV